MNRSIEGIKKEACTGCNACYNICAQNAIEMITDNEGFLYPKVNNQLCNECGICKRICPSLNNCINKANSKKPDIYAAWSLDDEIRKNSTSGGIFSELAKVILENGGYVVGAQYNQRHTVEHCIISNIEELKRLRQSKYMQSDIGVTYKKVKQLVEQNKLVLFCGTPCHAAGLSNYLKKDYDNLILCDFICRGVNSPKVYLKYLEMLRKKYDSDIKEVIFKNKIFGWNRFSTLIKFKNGKRYIKDRYNDPYMVGYITHNYYMRPSCHKCMYKTLPRVADLTLGDFWGIGNTRPHLDEDKGTSVIFINSEKGRGIFDKIKHNIFFEECTFEESLKGNSCILNPALPNENRQAFFKDLNKMPFDKLVKKYYDCGLISNVKRKIKRLLLKIKRII